MTIRNLFRGDSVLWVLYLAFVLISILEVFSAASSLSYKSGDYMSPVYGHIAHFIGGTLVLWAAHTIPSRWYKLAVVLLPVSWLLLVMVMVLTSLVNGASRWLFATELAKICTVISAALILSRTQEEKHSHPVAFKYIVWITVLTTILIAPENLSTALILVLTIIIMMFVGRVPFRLVVSLIAALMIAGATFVMVSKITPPSVLNWMNDKPLVHRVATWMSRVNEFGKDSDEKVWDIYGKDAQRIYANMAIREGGLVGKGPGNSLYREYLPQAYSDFIYAIIIEETGLLGGTFVVFLYVVTLIRSFRIANKSPYLFTSLMVMGLITMLFIQALVNMFVAVGIIPVTGQPLPLISRGGWSIMSSCLIFGIIIGAKRDRRIINEIEKKLV